MKRFLIFLIAALAVSCGGDVKLENVYNIALPEDICALGEDIKVDYEIIKLYEEDDNALVADIEEIIPYKDRLYILTSMMSGSNLFIFKDTGEFIKKFPKGRGPGEFMGVMDILVDEQTGIVEVLSGVSVYCYDFEGNFLEKRDLPKANILAFEKIGEDYLLYTPRLSEQNKHYYRLYNCATKTEERLLEGFDLPVVDIKPNIFKDVTGRVCFKGMYGDTIYTLDENRQCVAVTTLAPFLNEMPAGNFKRLSDLAKSLGNEYALFSGVNNFGSRLWGMSVSGEKNYDIIYDSQTQTTYKNLFNSMRGINCAGCYDGWWYYTVYPDLVANIKDNCPNDKRVDAIIEELEQIANNNPDDGNPLIIKVKYRI